MISILGQMDLSKCQYMFLVCIFDRINLCRWFGVIVYIIFLFLVIVVLLNLLIAQMSDTYGNVQLDAQRSLAINRAWIVARVEHNSLIARVSITIMIKYFYIGKAS